MSLPVGERAPHFALRNQHRKTVALDDLQGAPAAIIFIPFAFTRTCQGELCEIRDNIRVFEEMGVRVVAITCNTFHANAAWAEQQGYQFDLLSDFWPHGATARAYDCFDEEYGYAKRATFFIDGDGMITDVVSSEELGVARPFSEYKRILVRG